MKKIFPFLLFIGLLSVWTPSTSAHHVNYGREGDMDLDGLLDSEEIPKYGTNPENPDSDGDGKNDGDEALHGENPLSNSSIIPIVLGTKIDPKAPKKIEVDLSEQRLRYYQGDVLVGSMLISSGLARTPTPKGTFKVQVKRPSVHYRGAGYNFPNTKWNLQFLPRYYIHGAYWHNKFGTPRSHGCVNVAYEEMSKLYAFADPGTPIVVHD